MSAERTQGELDRDSRLTPRAGGVFDVEVSAGWGIYGIPNGGYLAFMGAKALGEVLDHPDPITVTTHYARRTEPGPATIHTEVFKRGRRQSSGVARLIQGGKERFRVTATFADLSSLSGPTTEEGSAPPIPSRQECVRMQGAPPSSTFAERVDMAFVAGSFVAEGTAPMQLGGYIRLADGREPDALSLLLFADAWPPPALNAIEDRMWVPTVELTVHIRRRPSPGWIKSWFETRYLIDGALEEDGRLWDAEGRLVALSRQYAWLQPG